MLCPTKATSDSSVPTNQGWPLHLIDQSYLIPEIISSVHLTHSHPVSPILSLSFYSHPFNSSFHFFSSGHSTSTPPCRISTVPDTSSCHSHPTSHFLQSFSLAQLTQLLNSQANTANLFRCDHILFTYTHLPPHAYATDDLPLRPPIFFSPCSHMLDRRIYPSWPSSPSPLNSILSFLPSSHHHLRLPPFSV